MKIEIKKSSKPIEYSIAIDFLQKRLTLLKEKKCSELIWVLEHPSTYTAGSSFNENEILDKSIKLIRSNRGGKITHHGPGQSIFYFVIDLTNKKKDIRKFVRLIEETIIDVLKEYQIIAFREPKNIGVWVNHKNKIKKIASIGIRVSRWIAFHGFAININNNLDKFKKIVPCGIKDRDVINLQTIKKQNYTQLNSKVINKFIQKLEI